ncbi:MAG: carboxypeptidase-like regulatory domain-containing protein [Candidatus Solibacter sp.]|nr:carboxypeptidase-like regulatory domain-containing protein [Candidatus Solibacter sp.]
MQRSVLLSAATMLVVAILLISTGGVSWTQTITGTILGTVTDPSGNVIVGAKVMLINDGTRDQRSATSDMTGGFVVPSLLPKAYTVRVESQSFQTYQRTGNALTASARLSLGDIQLNVGSLTETIAVTAQGPVVHHAFDNWQVSGITSFSSGTPSGIGLSTTNSADLTGGGDGQRVLVIADPRIPHSKHTIEHMFNTAAFALPGKGDPGNAPRTMVRGPGINNWDLTVFKLFPIKGEQRSLQLRWEIYNLPNHTQFSGMDTGARFDPATGAQTNGLFGTATSARSPRQMQVSLRFSLEHPRT